MLGNDTDCAESIVEENGCVGLYSCFDRASNKMHTDIIANLKSYRL